MNIVHSVSFLANILLTEAGDYEMMMMNETSVAPSQGNITHKLHLKVSTCPSLSRGIHGTPWKILIL